MSPGLRAALDCAQTSAQIRGVGEQLRRRFNRAADLLTGSLEDVARAIGRARRTFFAYRSGERRVTPEAARALARYLRLRAGKLREAADDLEDEARKQEGDDDA